MNNSYEHTKLVDELLIAIGGQSHYRCWPRFVGFDRLRKIHYGINGECDIEGVMMPFGRMFGIEVKTGSGRLSKDQILWRNMLIKYGAVHIVARSVEQVLGELDAAFYMGVKL